MLILCNYPCIERHTKKGRKIWFLFLGIWQSSRVLLDSDCTSEPPGELDKNVDPWHQHSLPNVDRVCFSVYTGPRNLYFKQTERHLLGAGVLNHQNEKRENVQETLAQNWAEGRSPSAYPATPLPQVTFFSQPSWLVSSISLCFTSPQRAQILHVEARSTIIYCPLNGLQNTGVSCVFILFTSLDLNATCLSTLPKVSLLSKLNMTEIAIYSASFPLPVR